MSQQHLSSESPAHLSRKSSAHLSSPKRSGRKGGAASPPPQAPSSPSLESCFNTWLFDQKAQGFTEKTVQEREGFCRRIIWFLETECGMAEPSLEDLNTDTIRKLLTYVREPHPTGRFGQNHPHCRSKGKPRTVFAYWREIQAFCNFALAEGLLDESPMRNVKAPKVNPDPVTPFTEEQISALLAAADTSNSPLRNRCILLLLLDSAIRVSEMCQLTVGSVAEDPMFVIGKGNRKRAIFVGATTRRLLRQYVNKCRKGAAADEPLFLGEGGTRRDTVLQPNGVRILLRKLGQAAGITGIRVSPHSCRHTAALMLLKNGCSAYNLQHLLGHSDMEMTRRYLNISQQDLAKAHAAGSPVDRLRLR